MNTPRRFYGALPRLADVQRMMAMPTMPGDLEKVMTSAGIGHLTAELVRTLQSADPAVMKSVSVPIGQTLEWMALRNNGRPDIIRRIRWGGSRPFGAYELFLDDGEHGYAMLLPKDCGNLSLARIEPSPMALRRADEARRAEAARRDEEARRAEDLRKATEAEAARKAEEARQADERQRADEERKRADAQRAVAEVERPAEEVTRAAEDPGHQGAPTLATANQGERKARVDVFIDAFGGKERRVRDRVDPVIINGVSATTIVPSGQCAPLVGMKVGLDFRLAASEWRLVSALGVTGNTKVARNSTLLAEAEINRWFDDKGFVGSGIGVWDVTHSETLAPTWLIHGGREIARHESLRVLFMGEGRLFLDKLDDVPNNYQAWAGFRFLFR
jgi:hypothetical protein